MQDQVVTEFPVLVKRGITMIRVYSHLKQAQQAQKTYIWQ
jgi:hypothetical protein